MDITSVRSDMLHPNLETLKSFGENDLPDLDVAVFGALERFAAEPLPSFPKIPYTRPLIVGSGNAAVTGRILFNDYDAVLADESNYEALLERASVLGAVVISSSGEKHAIGIVQTLTERNVPTVLLTNNYDTPAREFLPDEHIVVFPKNREPYTYNVSTYLSLIFSKTEEDPSAIHSFISEHVAPAVPDTLSSCSAFFITVPPQYGEVCDMFSTKFDELFGPKVSGRVFTTEGAKHAKTVIPSESECFIQLGKPEEWLSEAGNTIAIPLPLNAGYAAVIAVGYFVIGQIQKQHPPYFKDHIAAYVKKASTVFGQTIPVIVE